MGTLSEQPDKNLYKALLSNMMSVASLCLSTEPVCGINAYSKFSYKIAIH